MSNNPMKSPLLPLRGLLVFPSMVLHLDVGREKSIASLENAMMGEQMIFLASQKEVAIEDPSPDEIYRIGTLAKIKQMIKLPNGTIRVLIEGIYRAEIIRFIEQDTEFVVEINKLRSEEHTSELQSRSHLVCRLLLENNNNRL